MGRHRDEAPPPTATEALSRLRVDDLRRLAVLATGERAQGRKTELVALVARQLEGDGLRGIYERLGETERAAVIEAVHGLEGRFDAARFRAKYGRDPEWSHPSGESASQRPWEKRPLAALALVFCGQRVLPVDVRARLAAFVPSPSASEVGACAAPAAHAVLETERAAQHDLLAVLRLVEAGKLAVSDKTRRPGAAATRLVAGVLEGGDFYAGDEDVGAIKAFAWPLLVQAAGLAVASGSRLALTRAGARALTEPPAATLARAWTKWQSSSLLDEFSRVDAIKGQTGRGRRGLTSVAGRRGAIAGALADCPVGRWVAVDELFRHVRSSDLDFEVTRNAWHLYLCEPEYGSLGYDGHGVWDILQARYALAILLEYAATLGVVDVACVPPAGARDDYRHLWGADDLEFLSRYDGLTHIRVNALGAFCLGVTEAYDPAPIESRAALSVLPDLEIAALGEHLTHADRLALDRYAERIADRTWRLEPERLLAAIESGDTAERVRDFLAARSSAPLPNTVVNMLDDIDRRSAALIARGAAVLIDCADPALAVQLARDRRTRGHCLLAGERTLAVPAASEATFRRAARELGYVVGARAATRAA